MEMVSLDPKKSVKQVLLFLFYKKETETQKGQQTEVVKVTELVSTVAGTLTEAFWFSPWHDTHQ